MDYNICKNCGANGGRAGTLITSKSVNCDSFCMNCYDTKKTGAFVIHANLNRTDEEIEKTSKLLNLK